MNWFYFQFLLHLSIHVLIHLIVTKQDDLYLRMISTQTALSLLFIAYQIEFLFQIIIVI